MDNCSLQTLAQNNDVLQTLVTNDNVILLSIFVVGGIIAVVAIVFSIGHNITRTKEREKSRRELAAYVAEGSMTPEDAERLIKASPKET